MSLRTKQQSQNEPPINGQTKLSLKRFETLDIYQILAIQSYFNKQK